MPETTSKTSTKRNSQNKKKKQKKKPVKKPSNEDIDETYIVPTDIITDDDNEDIPVTTSTAAQLVKKPLKREKLRNVTEVRQTCELSTVQISDDDSDVQVITIDQDNDSVGLAKNKRNINVTVSPNTQTSRIEEEVQVLDASLGFDTKERLPVPEEDSTITALSIDSKVLLKEKTVDPRFTESDVKMETIPLIGDCSMTGADNASNKRPTASDFMDASNETTEKTSKTSKRGKRPKATDFVEKSDVTDSTSTILSSEANPGKEESMQVSTPDHPLPDEDVTDTIQDEEVQEPDTDLLGGGFPFLGYDNFDAYSNVLLPQVVQFLKVTKLLPSTKDEYDFFLSYPTFMAFSKNQGQRVLQLIGKMFKHHHVYQAWNTLPTNTVTGIEEQTEAVVEANDTLLERVDKIMDMLKQDKHSNKLEVQQKSSKNVLVAAWNANSSTQQNKPIRLIHSKNILRPQLKWAVKPDNSSVPFVPHIREKPHAKVPLQEIYKSLISGGCDSGISSFIRSARGDQTTEYPHPYQQELESLEVRPWQFELSTKQEPKELKDTPLSIIDQPEQLLQLCDKLSTAREIAIDLEAHSYRSYLGFTCLMQLSTRTEDFIVDTLALRTELLPLNKIFTNPDILKVLHGARNDIVWLQRDLGLYIVNMFDTFHASKQLGLPRCSLSYLLNRHCDVTSDKQYQLADWRIRPLPDVMIKYAREDTHFLLYIYDCLRYELLHQGPHTLESVYRNSRAECEQVFKKPVFTDESYTEVYAKTRIPLQPQQKECLKLIYKWRDQTARSEDESTAFVLPNHMMFKIAELLPNDQEGILGCCNPPPPLIRLHVQELNRIVEKGRHYNPLLDPANTSVNEAEYTPGFLDTTHQHSVESIFNPKLTPARRIKERTEIFYVPKSGPDLKIKTHSQINEDTISLASETGTISESVSSLQFFNVSTVKSDIADAVKAVKDSMSAPFQLFMSKIEQLRDDEKEKEKNVPSVVYPIQEEVPEEDKDEEDRSVIIFNVKNKRPHSEETNELRSTSKRPKKSVGDVTAFNYEEITMSKLAENEDVKPLLVGDMLNKGEDSRAKQIRKRTTMKSGNKSSFQSFLKSKFKK